MDNNLTKALINLRKEKEETFINILNDVNRLNEMTDCSAQKQYLVKIRTRTVWADSVMDVIQDIETLLKD